MLLHGWSCASSTVGPFIKLSGNYLADIPTFPALNNLSMLGDIGGVLLTILLVPLLIVGLFVVLLAGLVDECAEFFQNTFMVLDNGRRS